MKTWDTVAIVGVGLIGGSIGLSLRERGLAREVVGIGRRPATLRTAKRRGAVTRTTTDLENGVARAELVIVCTPVAQVADFARQAAWHALPGAIITDVGSTKGSIVETVTESLASHNPRQAVFIGSHPMAGSEKQGPAHARADLLDGRVVVVTPTSATPTAARSALERFWKSLGARIIRLAPRAHDEAVASISHVPHLVAAALAAATAPSALPLVAGGWLDTTRVAAGDPELWTQILSENRLEILQSLTAFEQQLAQFRRGLVYDDPAMLKKLLEAGKRVRDQKQGDP